MKYRKKPVVVEAEQWLGPESKIAGVEFRRPRQGDTSDVVFGGGVHYVTTIHDQTVDLEPGDWVITEPDGKHHYPCKPDIFEATYEKVEVEEKVGSGKIEYPHAPIDTFNKFLVGLRGNEIAIVRPPLKPISVDDALLLAAYLVVMADPLGEKFASVLDAVENT